METTTPYKSTTYWSSQGQSLPELDYFLHPSHGCTNDGYYVVCFDGYGKCLGMLLRYYGMEWMVVHLKKLLPGTGISPILV